MCFLVEYICPMPIMNAGLVLCIGEDLAELRACLNSEEDLLAGGDAFI